MKKLTITKIYRSNKDKEGNPLKTKDGRPYSKVSIKAEEFGERWLSGFENATNARWKEGDQIEVDVEERGEYLNFKTINPQQAYMKSVLDEKWSFLMDKLADMEEKIDSIKEDLSHRP